MDLPDKIFINQAGFFFKYNLRIFTSHYVYFLLGQYDKMINYLIYLCK